jgi:putative transposase
MCEALAVSAGGSGARASRVDSPAEPRRQERVRAIEGGPAEGKHRPGSPRMAAELNARRHECSGNTVAERLREHGVRAQAPRRFVRTTDSRPRPPVAEDLLARDFGPPGPDEPRSADITYVPTREGGLSLAVVGGLSSRMAVGWARAEPMAGRLVVDAPERATARRRPGAGLLAHSDRGSRCASDHYRRAPAAAGLTCSMSAVGPCWGRAPVERFFGGPPRAIESGDMFATRARARAGIFEGGDVFATRAGLPSSLGCLSPAELERAYSQTHR